MASAEFDIFLSHNSHDKTEVLKLSHQLKDLGFEPWVDAWNLVSGEQWLPKLEEALASCTCCAVIIGPHGMGNVHETEMWIALQRGLESKQGDRQFRIIPILLPNATRGDRAKLPRFLTSFT